MGVGVRRGRLVWIARRRLQVATHQQVLMQGRETHFDSLGDFLLDAMVKIRPVESPDLISLKVVKVSTERIAQWKLLNLCTRQSEQSGRQRIDEPHDML